MVGFQVLLNVMEYRADVYYNTQTGADRDIQKFREHRLSLPMHEHACFDALRRTRKYI